MWKKKIKIKGASFIHSASRSISSFPDHLDSTLITHFNPWCEKKKTKY